MYKCTLFIDDSKWWRWGSDQTANSCTPPLSIYVKKNGFCSCNLFQPVQSPLLVWSHACCAIPSIITKLSAHVSWGHNSQCTHNLGSYFVQIQRTGLKFILFVESCLQWVESDRRVHQLVWQAFITCRSTCSSVYARILDSARTWLPHPTWLYLVRKLRPAAAK